MKNQPQRMDGRKFLEGLPRDSADLLFFDPQYRGGLDRLAYGNEGSRQKDRIKLPQMDDVMIADFIQQIALVLKPSRYCCLWVDKFTVGEHRWADWVHLPPPRLQLMDIIVWRKDDIGNGYRSRRASEYLLILQKHPAKAKGTWQRKPAIPDVWTWKEEKAALSEFFGSLTNTHTIIANELNPHPHAKPIGLQASIIRATTQQKGLVVDPAAGGYSVLKACQLTNRDFLGCDLNEWRL